MVKEIFEVLVFKFNIKHHQVCIMYVWEEIHIKKLVNVIQLNIITNLFYKHFTATLYLRTTTCKLLQFIFFSRVSMTKILFSPLYNHSMYKN